MEVQVTLVCLITAVMSQQPERMVKYYHADCVDNSNCMLHSTCNRNVCKCNQGYQRNGSGQCEQCPGPADSCEDCCYPPHSYICDSKICVCGSNCNDSFILAAQVALGAALTIAFLALAALFWKTCQHRNGSRGHLPSLLREHEGSLSSMQRFVLQRLRDRPPRYEDTNHIQLEKPPPYQEAVTNCESQVPDIWDTSPPLYCEALHSSTGRTLTEENEPVQQANMSMVSDTRAQREGESSSSDSCQLGGANNFRYTLHEARQMQHSETELYM
uniref:EGF-like domain-containing protein n=1 Tax=Coptotermes formosanus TaxID=36987 RepID=R4V450_COPFO|nr:hypothetical protein [Coptotermes formosanus]